MAEKIFTEQAPAIEIKGNALVHITFKGVKRSTVMPLAAFQQHINAGMRAIQAFHREQEG